MAIMCKKDECCGSKGICIHEKRMLAMLALFAITVITYALIHLFNL
ncbi:MAG: hypothetical protein WAX77_13200 [Methylococcaceae bacterium]